MTKIVGHLASEPGFCPKLRCSSTVRLRRDIKPARPHHSPSSGSPHPRESACTQEHIHPSVHPRGYRNQDKAWNHYEPTRTSSSNGGQNWSSQSTEKAKLKVAILSPAAAQMEAPERTCAPGLSPHQAPPLALLSWPNLPSLPDPPPSFLSHVSAPPRTVRLNPTSTLHSQELSLRVCPRSFCPSAQGSASDLVS